MTIGVMAVMAEVVIPVVGQMIDESELVSVKLRDTGKYDFEMLLELAAGDEVDPDLGGFFIDMRTEYDNAARRAMLADQVQDFVAESRFGWAEQRFYIEGKP